MSDDDKTCPVVAAAVAAELERRDAASEARRALRLLHGNAIEGDDVCEHEIELAQLRADRDALRPLVEAVRVAMDDRDCVVCAENAAEDSALICQRCACRLALADAVIERMGER